MSFFYLLIFTKHLDIRRICGSLFDNVLKSKDKANCFTSLILVRLWKAFLLAVGHIPFCLTSSSVIALKAAIILIYTYFSWLSVRWCPRTNEHTLSCKAQVHMQVHTDMQMQCRCSLGALCSGVLQYESRESSSHHMAPEGPNEGEFCFSFESLQGIEKVLSDAWEQKELGTTLSSLPLIIFPPPLIPLSCPPLFSLVLPLSMNWFRLITLHTCPLLWLQSRLLLT